MAHKINLTTLELHQLKWLLGQWMLFIAFWALMQLDFGTRPILLLGLLSTMVTLIRPSLPGRIPSFVWKGATSALVLIILLDFIMNSSELMLPMVRMIVLLALYRSLQYRKRREDLQMLLLGLFMLVITGVLTVSLLFAVQILIFTPLAMALLFVVNLLESSHNRVLSKDDWDHFRWGYFLSRIRRGMDFRMLAFSTVVFVAVVGISSLVFVLFPRIRMDQALPSFMQMRAMGKTGFSDRIYFGAIKQLISNSQVAMRVEVSNRFSIPSRPYWRMVVLDQYYYRNPTEPGYYGDSSFVSTISQSGSGYGEEIEQPDYNYLYGPRKSSVNYNTDQWTFFLEGDTSAYLPLLGPFQRIRFSKKSKFWVYSEINVFKLSSVSGNVLGYTVSGMEQADKLQATAEEINAFKDAVPTPQTYTIDGIDNTRYPLTTLILPPLEADREYLQQILDQTGFEEGMSLEAFNGIILPWLHGNYTYDLATDMERRRGRRFRGDGDEDWDWERRRGRDSLIRWMQDSTAGWCEHFTGSYLLLARAAGFPSRAIAGFAGASWNEYENYLVVRNSHAHAWVEVYDHEGSWVRVDPTPGVDTDVEENSLLSANLGMETGWEAWVDSLRMVWYRKVVNFDQSDQLQMASNIRQFGGAMLEEMKHTFIGWWKDVLDWLTGGWDRDKVIRVAASVAVIGFLLLAFRLFYWWVQDMWQRGRIVSPWSRKLHPVRRKAGRLLTEMRSFSGNENEREKEPERIYSELRTIRFGPTEEWPDFRKTFRQARRILRKARSE